jgi:hypothetical protein
MLAAFLIFHLWRIGSELCWVRQLSWEPQFTLLGGRIHPNQNLVADTAKDNNSIGKLFAAYLRRAEGSSAVCW